MKYSTKVSFITVNFNQPEVTLQLLDSLQGINYSNWELIIVDNGSSKTVPQNVLHKDSRVKYLQLEENLGFAGGNNRGIDLADGEFLFFVNNDTEVSPNIVEPLLQVFKTHDTAGMVSPKIVYHHTAKLIQYAGSTELNPYTMRNSSIGNKTIDTGQFNDIRPTAYIHGAAMMIPRKVIDQVGLMFEDYFLYYEELDWSERVKNAGYSLWYCGESVIYHKESLATGVNSPIKIYYLNRNRLVFARRNFSWLNRQIAIIYFLIIAFPKNYLVFILQGRNDLAKALSRAVVWNLSTKVASIK